MKSFALTLFVLFSLVLHAQSPKPGSVETVTIPGTEVSFKMAFIPAGSVSLTENGPEAPVEAFWMGVHEVTQQEFTLFQHVDKDSKEVKVETDEPVTRPSPPYTDMTFGMGSGGNFPSISISQQAALFYCYWLYVKTGEFYRLPTEAEWAYACLAGSKDSLPAGMKAENLDDFAWYYGNSEERYRPVGSKKPNPWGLYDMIGNVAEWTLDQYTEDVATAFQAAPEAGFWVKPDKRYGRAVRGGSYDDYTEDCDCRHRVKSTVQWQKRDPQVPKSLWWNTDSPFVGFRLVKPAKQPAPEDVLMFFEEAIKW